MKVHPDLSLGRFLLLSLLLCVTLSAHAVPVTCPMVKIHAEQLPDLHVARACHALFYANGEVVVAGGHTDGFVPTLTAEYFADGEWHLMDMTYTADFALCQTLTSGKVLLAGGMAENLGIGQLWSMQIYDPVKHTFSGFGCLDKKRTWPSGGMVDNGRVIISGNWYSNDAIGCFRGGQEVDSIKSVTQARVNPFIVRTAPDNAVIFGWFNTKGVHYDSIWVDRFRGEPFRVPLLDEWRQLWSAGTDHRMMDCCVGDTATGDFTYLLPVQNKAGEVALMKIHGEDFSLLPTAQPVPVQGINGVIHYLDCVVADRRLQCAYLAGLDVKHVLYVVRIDKPASGWDAGEAQLTLFYTDPLPEPIQCIPVLTDDGDLVFAGGAVVESDTAFHTDNFNPNKAAYILRLGTPAASATAGSSWWWLLVVAVLLLAVLGYVLYRRYGNNSIDAPNTVATAQSPSRTGGMPKGQGGSSSSLFPQIAQLMEERQLFLNSDLKLSDVARELGVQPASVSSAVRAARGCSFPAFVNEYRIDYAKRLMLQDPDAKLSSISRETGFTNDTSFFRTFKGMTGMTPSEWRSEQGGDRTE